MKRSRIVIFSLVLLLVLLTWPAFARADMPDGWTWDESTVSVDPAPAGWTWDEAAVSDPAPEGWTWDEAAVNDPAPEGWTWDEAAAPPANG